MRRTQFGCPPPFSSPRRPLSSRTPLASSSKKECIRRTPSAAFSSSFTSSPSFSTSSSISSCSTTYSYSSCLLKRGNAHLSRPSPKRHHPPKCIPRLLDSSYKENLPPVKEWPPTPCSGVKLEEDAAMLKSSGSLSFEGRSRRHVLRPQFRLFEDEERCQENADQKDQPLQQGSSECKNILYSKLDYLLSDDKNPSEYDQFSCGRNPQDSKKELLVPSLGNLSEGRWSPSRSPDSSLVSSTPIRL